MRNVLADYHSMCEMLGPLNFEAFCAGYTFYEQWTTAREGSGGVRAVEFTREDRRASASYSA